MIWGRPLLRPALAACSVWVCTCAGVCMWALAVMCTCIQMHACRIVCKITSMCAHVYMGACRCVRACAFPTAVVSSAKGGAEPAIQSGHSRGFCYLVGLHVCVTLHTRVSL